MSKVITKAFLEYLIPTALGGLIGGLLVGAFFVWPTVYEADWWEVFTALGTVGATISAVGISWWSRVSQESDRHTQALRSNLMASRGLVALCLSLAELSPNADNKDFIAHCAKEIFFYTNKISHAGLLLNAYELGRLLMGNSAGNQSQGQEVDYFRDEVKRLNGEFSNYISDFLEIAIKENVNVYSY